LIAVPKVTSFNVFLGHAGSKVTPSQAALLDRSELAILDPFRGADSLIRAFHGKHCWIGRLDVDSLVSGKQHPDAVVEALADVVARVLGPSSFHGMLLANWEDRLPQKHLFALADFVASAGLLLYLEAKPPTFLADVTVLQHARISGIVIRNAAILPNGQHRDYFDMTHLQPTIRAIVKESCIRDFSALAWESYSDGVVCSNAIVKRAIQWCGFYSVVTWIGCASAESDPSVERPDVEPMGAFEWLKEDNVIDAHTAWRSNDTVTRTSTTTIEEAWRSISAAVPEAASLRSAIDYSTPAPSRSGSFLYQEPVEEPKASDVSDGSESIRSASVVSLDGDNLGCVPLGFDVTPLAYAEVLQEQLRLRNLGLLHPIDQQKVTNLGVLYRKFHDKYLAQLEKVPAGVIDAVKELSTTATAGLIRIHLGLSPGFQYGSSARFWAVIHDDADGTEMFISRDAQGLSSTVLHAFLSNEGLPRETCFDIELKFADWCKDTHKESGLSRRMAQDIDMLTPEERILLLQQLVASGRSHETMTRLANWVRKQLLDAPTHQQLNEVDSVGYMEGKVSETQLLMARFDQYEKQAIAHPDMLDAARFFVRLQQWFLSSLRRRKDADIKAFTTALHTILKADRIDARADILGLATFCAARKAAFDEVYLEVTDRNPLLNDQSDQAAVFAESFALGSRCEVYFDVSPNTFGRLLSDRFRTVYKEKQPPKWNNGAPEFATAYGGAGIDVDPDGQPKPLPQFQRFGFLSVFAVPALVDIALLSTIGRGLYLSAGMTANELQSATNALMISLLLAGATGTWIAVGGSYYLVSMAFSAMNVFVLTRLIAGMAFTVAGALLGFVIITGVQGPGPAVVFFLYLIAFTGYLTLFAAIASFQMPGSSFLSGRAYILGCIPILLLSPIITPWSNNDVYVYLAVFYLLIAALTMALRRVSSQWVTWYQGINQTNDTEVRKWYTQQKAGGDSSVLDAMSDPAALKVCREALLADVQREQNKSRFTRATQDDLVRGLARDYVRTNFLLDWYNRYADVPRPIPFSSGWNIQVKVALNTLVELQKGIRLHNAFMHWRQAGDEVGCGILYFLVALMDKWVELVTGVKNLGLVSGGMNEDLKVPIGFALAYYLIGAVLIDVKAQELHGAVDVSEPKGVRNSAELRQQQKDHIRLRRRMYSRTLFRFLSWHCWALAFTASVVYMLQATVEGTVMFLAYVFAYTGLLWYQYTKIFAGQFALRPLLISVGVGLVVGVILKIVIPHFHYGGVISLGTATWTAAILCLWSAKIGMPEKPLPEIDEDALYFAYIKPWDDPHWSQPELLSMFEKLKQLPADDLYRIRPMQYPGNEVTALLRSASPVSDYLTNAFPDCEEMLDVAIQAFESGQIEIDLLALDKMTGDIQAVTARYAERTQLIVGVRRAHDGTFNMRGNCQVIAELLLWEVANSYFHIPTHHACLVPQLVSSSVPLTMRMMLADEQDRSRVITWARKEVLRQYCLGIDCDLRWEKLPHAVRKWFLSRAVGGSYELSTSEERKLRYLLGCTEENTYPTHIARCDLGAESAATLLELDRESHPVIFAGQEAGMVPMPEIVMGTMWSQVKKPLSYLYHHLGLAIKYMTLALVADMEWHREFDHAMRNKNKIFKMVVGFLLTALWRYSKFAQDIGLAFFLYHDRPDVKRLMKESKGMTVSHKRSRIVIQSSKGIFTGFRRSFEKGFKLHVYKGDIKSEPSNQGLLVAINTYSQQRKLQSREEFENGSSINLFEYDYEQAPKGKLRNAVVRALPESRRCVRGRRDLENVVYNNQGLVESGSYMTGENLTHFRLRYRKGATTLDELLMGEFVLAHLSANVSWCAPPTRRSEKKNRWIPNTKVTKATFVQGPDVFESSWKYDHQMHPTITTYLNGSKVPTPPLIEHDWLSVLKKPSHTRFADDDPLLNTSAWNTNAVARMLGLAEHRVPISTSMARSRLWKAWKNGRDLDGVVIRWLDEKLIRKDPVLRKYWRLRDAGNLRDAKRYLAENADVVRSSVDMADDIAGWTPIAYKLGDLISFGSGGDTIMHTTAKDVGKDTNETLHVLAADNGTWPNEGGGVSACRRDMINNLETIKWHMVAESATDFGIPKHQTEQNVLSLKVIPLWGLDFLTPTHGLFKNRLDSQVDMLQSSSTAAEIKLNFVPIMSALVRGARAVTLSHADLQQATRALVNLHDYFENKRHWGDVWKSDVSKDAWRSLWLEDMSNARGMDELLETELPTLGHFETALELWLRYLFVFSIQVPDKIPAIFQASHHSVSAAYGIVCKIKRKCQLQIWDHAVAWRETNMCLSSALCKLPPFVRNSLLGLMRLTSVLILHNADTILPCADFFNPGWEVEIGTCQGTIEHRNSFKRKISPIVNGITDSEKFKPVKEIKTQKPTVTMLSHLWFAKDLKTAILAADIIVNEWGFRDYQLDVYGSIEKAPIYSNECQELLASKGLRSQVRLAGTADPMSVLEQTWLFLNSSLSEGLPLALGEAALTGAPVVCTDVGASLRVLSDPDDFSRYSAVVAPNDARALARAQIKMLAMLDEWSKYADDEPGKVTEMPFAPSPQDVEWITARMYEKKENRRKLGLMTRNIVQKSFSGDRYLREHEQMLWIGKSRRMQEVRETAAISDDPADISLALQLNAPINDDIIPRSARPSMNLTPGDRQSLGGSPATMMMEDSGLISASIYNGRSSKMSTRPSSKLSHMSSTSEDLEMSSRFLPSGRPGNGRSYSDKSSIGKSNGKHIADQHITALPRAHTSTSLSQHPTLATLASMGDSDAATLTGRRSRAAEQAYDLSVPYERANHRYRDSDVSIVNPNVAAALENPNSILHAEAPAHIKRDSHYRNLSSNRSTPAASIRSHSRDSFQPGHGRRPRPGKGSGSWSLRDVRASSGGSGQASPTTNSWGGVGYAAPKSPGLSPTANTFLLGGDGSESPTAFTPGSRSASAMSLAAPPPAAGSRQGRLRSRSPLPGAPSPLGKGGRNTSMGGVGGEYF
jgi:glycosyltransferase involved in cell wall biosynthesis